MRKRLLIAVLLLILLAGSAIMLAGWLLSRPVPVRVGTAPPICSRKKSGSGVTPAQRCMAGGVRLKAAAAAFSCCRGFAPIASA